ncbi:hypothetical protein TNCV_4383681 [Trichonephila clavipes]|nr:hypothetical protein TNCV_4383681 [Trichonephila clavipes]
MAAIANWLWSRIREFKSWCHLRPAVQWEQMHVKSIELKVIPLVWCGDVRKRVSCSGIVLVTSPRLKITNSVANSLRVAL